ncbi:MAG: uracil-DNA glycosylase, partial [Dehalococcoidia bacterium]|nr:uracil-DNA glycosylase [Dehalococcoidia bacterium]
TNAVLCHPRGDGINRPPSAAEIANCRSHLADTIAALDPPVVAALGRVALTALRAIAPHRATLADVATPVPWGRRWLVPLYHPSPRARVHRPFAQQVADVQRLANFVTTTAFRRTLAV